MELSQLRFKVFHKPGTAMSHVDGLSRLPSRRVNAIQMADLLNGPKNDDDGPAQVREEGLELDGRNEIVPARGLIEVRDMVLCPRKRSVQAMAMAMG
ncbi:hypothetical protein V7S43_011133 [Phytophthora oleae]|uniref:Uncharacterized protein n=1 Tax=Phytophthora oleae TaxID=2107226 RepID=A0ABD3FAF9_9STRA